MNCRPGCGACCIAPSISTLDKPAGEPCVHLTPDYRCTLFGSSRRPSCCSGLQPSSEMCGADRAAALAWLAHLEEATSPIAGPISATVTDRLAGDTNSISGALT